MDLWGRVVHPTGPGIAYVGIGSKDALSQVSFFFMSHLTCALDGMKARSLSILSHSIKFGASFVTGLVCECWCLPPPSRTSQS